MIRSLQGKACLPLVLAIAPGLFAQAKSDPGNSLKIAVLQGEGAVHNVRTGAVTQPVVEVRDESFKPVFGAEVSFEVPATGPGGTFQGDSTSYTGKTNAQGQIGAPFTPNSREGRYYIRVTATQGGRTGSTRIAQTNSTLEFSSGEPVKRERSKAWKVLLGIGGAAVVPAILLARRGGSDNGATNTGPPTVTLSPGSVSVGGPR